MNGKQSILRIIFATDMHGQEIVFKKFLNAGRIYKANALILGGDVTGKILVPIIEHREGFYEAEFMNRKHILRNRKEVEALASNIEFTGNYYVIVTKDEFEEFVNDKHKQQRMIHELMINRLKRWITLAEERLKDTSITLYVTGGNDDPYEITNFLKSIKSEYIKDPEDEIISLDEDHEMISCGYGNITPWRCPRDISEEDLYEKLDKICKQSRKPQFSIFNIHVPPYGTTLGTCPKLDTSVYPPRPIMGEYIDAGSIAVRKIIEKYQPLVGLHGHIHESRGVAKIGRTVCFNPGSEYSEGILRAVLLDIEKERIKAYSFMSG